MGRRLAAVGMSAGLVVGTGAGAVLNIPALAGATEGGQGSDEQGRGQEMLAKVLDELVEEGTITQSQADAILEKIEEDREEHEADRKRMREETQETIADLLGMTTDELEEAIRDGQTVADLAEENDVDLDDIVDALFEQLEKDLEENVESGDITQEQADKVLEAAPDRIEARLNGEQPEGGPGGQGGQGGPGGQGGQGGPGGQGGQGGSGDRGEYGQSDSDTDTDSASLA